MSELETWAARAADPDPAVAVEVWTDPATPASVLRRPPTAVLEHLLGDGYWQGTLAAVLRNPALPTTVVAGLATRAKGEARAMISRHVLDDYTDVPLLLAAAPVLTPARLSKLVNGLLFGWEHERNPDSARTTLATLLRAFVTSSNTRCRALAAEAFPLTLGPRHRYVDGEVSATKLAADSEVAVLVALARNYHMRSLPENDEGLAVRRSLLDNPTARVRTAARRAGVHVFDSVVLAALSAADGRPVPASAAAKAAEAGVSDPLDDPAPSVRVTAIVGGIHQQDGTRWARVLADPSPQVRKAAATHGYFTPSFVWTALAHDTDPSVRKAVASSRWAPTELQRRLLSDASPKVASAATAADPLSRPVRVRPSLPEDGSIMLPVSFSHNQQIRLLDCTAVALTLDQQNDLAAAARAHTVERTAARDRVITRLGNSRTARWVLDRWQRWCDVYSVPAPAPAPAPIHWEKQLAAPFVGISDADDRVTGALALFDAVLSLAAEPSVASEAHDPGTDMLNLRGEQPDPADLALLRQPWDQVLLPTVINADTVYGSNTPRARDLLTAAARLPRSQVDALLTTRIGIDDQQWKSARREAVDASAGPEGHLYAAHHLFWDTVTVAELAAWQRPTDPLLANALWGAATVTLHADRLSAATIDTLTQPAQTAGLSPI
ncbi:hypothetical protein [Amycolatopsis sp. NPDC004079]|uniref:hypothetical protein n=1 Tax=Amycolatopsis sp. NPDC004079 TaxID=3154549 RepID=UPI0033A31AC7